ncbi:MAG: hypothetical protein ACLQU2_22970 [Candidatus Binataceae bacterium]
MALIERDAEPDRWQGDACFLTQEFLFQAPRAALDPSAVVRLADALVNQRTSAMTFGLARWHSDTLMLGPICILRFGPLRPHDVTGFAAAAGREILGGLITRRPAGAMWYRVRYGGNDLILNTGLSGFVPRLPWFAYRLVQVPLHRATLRRAMRDLATHLGS